MSLHVGELEIIRAAELIREGRLVAFPTETVYGLGANALDPQAVRRIFEVKQRPWASPLIVHVADENMARSISAEWPVTAQKLAREFWPGPLTFVLKKAAMVPDVVTAGLDSVAVRVPSHPLALALLRQAGVPIAAPSANLFTALSPTTAEHVRQGLGDRVDLVLDGGATSVGIESTVVALHRAPPAILRPGILTADRLSQVAGVSFEAEMDLPHIVESPGQHPRHYAPRTRFVLLEQDEAAPPGRGHILPMPQEPQAFAAALYAELHEADQAGWEWIGIRRPPDTQEWAGVLDRLQRASTPGS